MKTALVFPGQGSQYVGMGKTFLKEEHHQWFKSICDRVDSQLYHWILEGPSDELDETLRTQPAVFIVNELILRCLMEQSAFQPEYFAGHSLGEYNALAAAGWATFEELLSVVQKRGRAMNEAADRVEGGMAALLRIDRARIQEICERVSKDSSVGGIVQIALYNSPDQSVISGANSALKRAIREAEDAGALKAVELDVSGPWHSRYMKPAVEPLREALEGVSWSSGQPVVTNVSAEMLRSNPTEGLLRQLTQPVQWTDSILTLLDVGVRRFIEVGPGDALKGMIERIARKTDHDVVIQNTDTLERTRSI